jgi:thiol-disulfide isomerase/thioredoxin
MRSIHHVRAVLLFAAVAAISGPGSDPAGAIERLSAGPPGAWLRGVRWMNASPPAARDLAGRVVAVEFWTFECINCRRTLPAMKALDAEYRGARDVAIVSVHTPELERERDPAELRRAIARLGIRYPVAQDNDLVAWRAFGNQYWPCLYLLDRRGAIRYRHIGELHPDTPGWAAFRQAIEELRKE